MGTFKLAGLPRVLRAKPHPTARAEGDGAMLLLGVFAENDPTDDADFEILVSTEDAQRLVAELAVVLQKIG
jgi:hypothetical protein